MDIYSIILELIDMRSFSSLWYWIALAVVWPMTSHRVMGVPYDMVQRAGRGDDHAKTDLETLVRINCNRLLFIGRVLGLWILGFSCAFLTGLGMLGFYYRVELAQALFLLAFPLSLVALLNLSTATRVEAEALTGDALHRRLRRHRIYTRIIGLVAIFVTAMWGMWQNLQNSALGG